MTLRRCALVLSKCCIILVIISLSHGKLRAQEHDSESWTGYLSSIRLNEKWAIWNDFHLVPYKFFIHRHGLSYYLSNGVRFSGGYAHLYQNTTATNQFDRDERRYWWQAQQWVKLPSDFSLSIRFRHDMRFREVIMNGFATNEELFNHRLRFQTTLIKRLTTLVSGAQLNASLMNEFHYNVGGDLPNQVNQNRTGFFLSLRKGGLNYITGYQVRTVPYTSVGTRFLHGFILRLSHSIDLRK